MTNRELLELAAKAGKYELLQFERSDGCFEDSFRTKDGYWNPLTDDGDALRLAVKLGLTLVIESDMVFCRNQKSDNAFREQGKDHYAATRRAIVRASAELGKLL